MARPVRRLFLRLDLFGSGAAFPEPILEPPGHGLHVAHATRSRRASTFGLECPIVLPHLAIGIAAGTAALFLNVVGDFTTPATGRVTLIFPFSERGRSFRLLIDRTMLDNGGTHIKEQNPVVRPKKAFDRPPQQDLQAQSVSTDLPRASSNRETCSK
jgi:hypothetical protein